VNEEDARNRVGQNFLLVAKADRPKVLALIARDGESWAALAKELGGFDVVERHRASLADAACAYFKARDFERRDRFDAKRKKRFKAAIPIAKHLADLLQQDGLWLLTEGLGAAACSLLPDGDYSPLQDLASSLERILDERSAKGAPKKRARAAAWLQATEIYETATGEAAGTSSSVKTDDRVGPFVRFITAFSTPLMPQERVTGRMVYEFLQWRASPDGKFCGPLVSNNLSRVGLNSPA
jgi:hypothetical protein